jgi:hypothetical protein
MTSAKHGGSEVVKALAGGPQTIYLKEGRMIVDIAKW